MEIAIPANAVQQVIECLTAEANAILGVAQQVHAAQIERALWLLANCQGKVLVVGVGKSGIIGQKIVATLRSIGTVAVFLHPCDALHGDLGIVGDSDVALILSHSGESEEILDLLPHLKRRHIQIIAIVGNLVSTLARQADVIIDATIEREACPLNLAPTASTTVALALSDALAMTLMQIKQLTLEHFAVNHPAGWLGKRLTLTVGDLMHSGRDNPTLPAQSGWFAVINAISQGGLGAVNIIGNDRELIGLITDGDLRRCVEKTPPQALHTLTAEQIMTAAPTCVNQNVLAYDALKIMENRPSQISVLPVVDAQNHCLGLIRLHDIVRSGL